MIFVGMVIEAAAGRREELKQAMKTMMAITRNEAGCVTYTYSADLDIPDRFHLLEMWENEELMNAHIDAEHSADFVAILGEAGRIVSLKAFSGDAQKFRVRLPSSK